MKKPKTGCLYWAAEVCVVLYRLRWLRVAPSATGMHLLLPMPKLASVDP